MDRDNKRKATAAPMADGDGRPAKRQRPSTAGQNDETPESTTKIGLKFLEFIRNAKDKTGRPIAIEFLTLPDRKLYPEYYKAVLLPIALDTIEDKLGKHAYPTITALESDWKRLVVNAKAYNDKRSSVYEDVERLRKTASNFFTKHNPAYRDSSYVAIPTPIPGQEIRTEGDQMPPARVTIHLDSPSKNAKAPQKTKVESSQPEEAQKSKQEESGSQDFKDRTFQQAQEQILDELIHYIDEESELEIFTPFHTLPARSLVDYYQIIRYPVSLKGVQKRVRGVHGRMPATGVSDFQSWDSFENEVSYIWRNARAYNEDGSEIFELAGELEAYFKERLALAKSQVEQPAQQKLKINLGSAAPPKQSIKIRLHAGRDSPSTSSRHGTPASGERGTPGVVVNKDALQRQQEMVATAASGVNGAKQASTAPANSRNPFSRSTSGSTPIPSLNGMPAAQASPVPQLNGVKTEAQPSPALPPARTNGYAPALAPSGMPPPSGNASRPHSGSPAPGNLHNPYVPQYHPPPPTYNGPLKELVANKFRPAGETAADSILPLLTVRTHPSLALPKPFILRIPASPTLTQQSLSITLPPSHTHLLITPHVPVALTSRPYRLFVKVNENRVSETVKPGVERRKDEPQFEARLERGAVTRIEVEVLAGTKERRGGMEEVVLERVGIFVHVLRG